MPVLYQLCCINIENSVRKYSDPSMLAWLIIKVRVTCTDMALVDSQYSLTSAVSVEYLHLCVTK